MKHLWVLLGTLILLVCIINTTPTSTDEEMAIPKDYELVAASSYGRFARHRTLYIQNIKSGIISEYRNGKFGAEIKVPEGCSLVAVSEYGSRSRTRTLYCRNNETRKIFQCSPE